MTTITLTAPEIAVWGLCGLALAAALWLLTAYRARIARVTSAIRRQTASPFNPSPRPMPPAVSVVVVAGDDATALEALLAKLFEQEWEGEMEVVVVNDGKNDDIKDVVTRIKHLQHRPDLFITFTPPGLRNISHRKLALTLGIKAAHNPVIITLGEQSRIYSTQWLGRMTEPFGREETEVVIGSALPAAKFDRGPGARYRSFTHGHDATVWLAAALGGKPFRAHRANMAFRRNLFFESGGFSSALNLRDGDDDIFISRICRPGNSAVVCAAQAAVRYARPTSKSEFRDGRPRRMFTSRRAGAAPAGRFWGLSSLAAWVMTLAAVGAVGLGIRLHMWIAVGVGAALLLATWTLLALTWRSTLLALRCRPAAAMVVPMVLRRPLTNFIHRLRSRRRRGDYRTTPA